MKDLKVFNQVSLGNFKVKNAIARSATYNYMPNQNGYVGEEEIKIYEELASNEVGLIITGQFYINEKGKTGLDAIGLNDEKFLPQVQKLVNTVHSYGSKIVAQLGHTGARSIFPDPVAPSVIELPNGQFAHELSIDEIQQIKNDFIYAAYLAQKAGFDGVQLHGAHGYLLTEFLSPITNKRTDLYGGSLENRFRLIREIVEGIQEKCNKDFPIFIKLNSNAEDDITYENELLYILSELKNLGLIAAELSGYEWRLHGKDEHCYYLDRAVSMRTKVNMPIILVGGVRNLLDMQKNLEAGIDMVSISRPFICEPDLLTKLTAGQEKSKCISCNKCFGLYPEKGKRCILHT